MSPIPPGGTIGILGGGQLGRMLALEARRLGYRTRVLDPDPESPGAQIADQHVTGNHDDPVAAADLAAGCDVITLDTEHVPATLLAGLMETLPVRPGASVLAVIQDRLEQRRFLAALGAPQTRHAAISTVSELQPAGDTVGFPAVLKTRRAGYDGKGQARVGSADELVAAWDELGRAPSVLEAFVHFEREVSVLLARGLDGEHRFYPIAENEHRHHILHTTRAPARISADLAARAEELGGRIAAALGHVGMMAVELFVTRDGDLLVNEIAPRTHNSGHYTLGACVTSQFEQHLRAICGLPLGDPTLLRPAMMLNVLGDSWSGGTPPWEAVFAHPEVQLHLYGKRRASPGRKMGHVLVLGEAAETVIAAIEQVLAPR